MFQTEPIHALQSLATEGLTQFMLAVSSLGYPYTLIPILVVIAFGFDFRRGFVLVQIVLWNTILTNFLKAAFALPRPDAVDSTLLQPGDDLPEAYPFERAGAPAFWAPLPAEVVSYYRELGDFSRGLPSGHCSVTSSLWGSMALLFRQRWLWVLSLTLIALMPLSRMYLARHFIADVLGGLAVGGLVIAVAWPVAIGALTGGRRRPLLAALPLSAELRRFVFYLLLPALVILVPGVGLENAMRMIGVNAGLWLLTRGGLPLESDHDWKRAARVLLAVAIYLVIHGALGALAAMTFGEVDLAEALVEGLSTFALTWGTPILCYRFDLYRRGEPRASLLELAGPASDRDLAAAS